jgi:hypothetical protein
MEENRNILESCATNVDDTDAQLVNAYAQYKLNQYWYQDLLHITLNEYHAFGEEEITTHRVQITLDAIDLGGI